MRNLLQALEKHAVKSAEYFMFFERCNKYLPQKLQKKHSPMRMHYNTAIFNRTLNRKLDGPIRRGVFDLSHDGVKFALADINSSKNQINELHYHAKTFINYANDLINIHNNQYTPHMFAKTVDIIKHYKNDAQTHFTTEQGIEFYGIAKYPFNKLSNIKEFLNNLYAETNVKIKLLDDAQEAAVAYDSVSFALGKSTHPNMLVWDVSTQSARFINKKYNEYTIIKSNASYENFYNFIKKEIKKGKDIYPIDSKEIDKIIEFALNLIKLDQSHEKIRNAIHSNCKIVGRGFIHNNIAQHYVNINEMQKSLSPAKYIDASHYNIAQIKEAIDLSATQIKKGSLLMKYEQSTHLNSDRELASLILIYVLMHKLDIKSVNTVNTKSTFGLLLQNIV